MLKTTLALAAMAASAANAVKFAGDNTGPAPALVSGRIGKPAHGDRNVTTYTVADMTAGLTEISWCSRNSHMLGLTLKFNNGEVLEHKSSESCDYQSVAGLDNLIFTNACWKNDHLSRMIGDTFYLESLDG